MSLWLPSQNGRFFDVPQRHKPIAGLVSRRLPSPSIKCSSPLTINGPFLAPDVVDELATDLPALLEGAVQGKVGARLDVLEREFLESRAKLLQLAAFFDRLDRGEGLVADDPRLKKLQEALEILQQSQPNRAEELQLLFSRQYDDDWQQEFDLRPR